MKSWPPRRWRAEECMKQRPCCAEAPTGGVRLRLGAPSTTICNCPRIMAFRHRVQTPHPTEETGWKCRGRCGEDMGLDGCVRKMWGRRGKMRGLPSHPSNNQQQSTSAGPTTARGVYHPRGRLPHPSSNHTRRLLTSCSAGAKRARSRNTLPPNLCPIKLVFRKFVRPRSS